MNTNKHLKHVKTNIFYENEQEMIVAWYNFVLDGTFMEMFGLNGSKEKRPSFTEDQVRAFCSDYPEILYPMDLGNFFLCCDNNGKLFVMLVIFDSEGKPLFYRQEISCPRIWNVECESLVFVLQPPF